MEKTLCASASDGRKWYTTTFTATGNTTRVHGWAMSSLLHNSPSPHYCLSYAQIEYYGKHDFHSSVQKVKLKH